ncbi:MAG: glycosyltransferase family 2 protein [Nitrospirae bacterium]|nr:glycosyltransferase family 2 protein [Nitrospirota bacterium]
MVLRAKPTVSAVVITFNEEQNVGGCLESLRWVDDLVVVDSESRDGTVAVARKFTDKVFVRPWPGFAAQRNFGMAQTTGDWIVILDADERVTREAEREITRWLATPEAERVNAAQVPRRNYFFGRWLRFGGAYPDLQWRLFRNGKIRYDEHTLDTPIIDGPATVLTQPFDHFTGQTLADRIRKIQRETDYKARERLTDKRTVFWSDLLFRPLATFLKVYVVKQGFRDGIEGLLYSALAGFYTYVRYVKLWELVRG